MPLRYALPLALVCLALPAAAAGLVATERRIVAAVDARSEAWIPLLAQTVDVQSATENLAGVRAVGEVYAREYRALGFETRWVDVPAEMQRGGHLVATRAGQAGAPRLLLIGHLDTVLQGEPFRRDDNRGYGSGASDMKGGNLVALEALRALAAADVLRGLNVTVVYTGDEEDPGAPLPAAREALLQAARQADVALAFEGASPGKAVTGRRGISEWRLAVTGTQGHSSGIFGDERGYGAIFEAARILDAFRTELREANLTYNPAVIVGGTEVTYQTATKSGTALGKTNVIPREVQVEGDLRFLGTVQFETARRKMQEIVAASLPGTSAKLEVAASYPSMAPNPGSERVLGVLDAVSRDLGAGPIVAQPPGERGAGDIAFVCEDGRLACLDGLGSLGEQEHAPGEYIELDALPLQVKRAALLMYRLSRGWTLQ
ncbi:MAG TPA: M20/M25/M40 family metallo-hydrolase [Steroidobacteraceae bacterium]|nr:M20/M25/M40 family metallo-hydrolase [Steroidobacteraceae bacterium]